MKRCVNCSKEFDDSKVFCTECGSPLAAVSGTGGTAAPSGSNGNLNTAGNLNMAGNPNTAGNPAAPAPEEPWYSQWKGTILAVIGLIVEWEWSALFGAILIGVGFILGKDSPQPGNKAVTAVLLVIGIILLIVTVAA